MAYTLEILYSPAYELLLSLSLYKRQTHLKYLDVGTKWTQNVESMISSRLKETLDTKENLYFKDLSVLLISQCPEKENIDSFLQWLENLSAGQIYELLTPWLSENMVLPTDLKSQSLQYINLMRKWNEEYFQKQENNLLKKLKLEANEKEKQLSGNISNTEIVHASSRFVIEADGVKRVYLCPTYHVNPISLVDEFRDTLFITYPYRKKNQDADEIIKMAKALGDDTRIRILQLLSEGSYTFTNIMKKLGMAKGNIHHHLTTLRAAGLLNIHLTNDKKVFYYSTYKGFTNHFKYQIDQLLNSEYLKY
ncbi:ArsR/SmtB family transcription factor [Chengkuizengella axinellae]|uniref:Winged helix-turn-helix domain-containing protein n=1 Tax=Chengkuizengella axinellae TaxID=3064388 RepID=A0ABT9J1R6_9BACL|nr:winged helix-turn-helix domain-containing protein [Chengkuizengella sp. 2205SS18-9]MDP5274949.1 winged helix-turn-helix domain-containing protein [Chengkuizengella sp. 2205SS18-9]